MSNLGLIQLEARVPRRSIPSSGVQHGLKVEALTYAIAPDGTRAKVASSVQDAGGAGDLTSESVSFYLDIPIDASEREAAIRQYVAVVSRRDPSARPLAAAGVPAFRSLFRQHRVGRYSVVCRVLDEGRPLAEARAELEVVFKGNFFEQDAFRPR